MPAPFACRPALRPRIAPALRLRARPWLRPALVLGLLAVAALPASADGPERCLRLGPLPPPPPAAEPALPQAEVEIVPEVDVRVLPADGEAVAPAPGVERAWGAAAAAAGAFELPGPGVWWLAARVRLDRWAELKLEVATAGGALLFLDGERVAGREAGAAGGGDGEETEEPEPPDGTAGGEAEPALLAATRPAARGDHLVMVRVEVGQQEGEGGTVRVTASADPAATGLAWTLEPTYAPARFERSDLLPSLGPLAVSRDGKLVGRRLRRGEPGGEGRASVEVVDDRGRLVASDLGGPAARPVAFAPADDRLLLSRRDGEGTDLLLWRAPDGPLRTVLEDEPDLGLVRWSPDGRFLLLASARGIEVREPGPDEPRRRTALRRTLPDYGPRRHLHLLDLDSGLRRRLTAPGDHVLEDAVFLPGGRQVVYGETVPQAERPWFATQIRRLDLAGGEDEVVATFSGGWEVRPQGFAAAPDGRRLAFVGPPDQVGGGRPEHNVYARQVWLLDLESGAFERISAGDRAYEASGDLPGWRDDGRALVVAVQDRARGRLGLLAPGRDGAGGGDAGEEGRDAGSAAPWSLTLLETGGEETGAVALAPRGRTVAFTVSSPAAPASLRLLATEPDARPRLLDEPAAGLVRQWRLAAPEDASAPGAAGETVEAWWYPPLVRADPDTAGTPLVLYYYGGSSPTSRGFSFTHQWLAANGYAVLVVNPRGAAGYGEAFADVHVGDWGPAAAADILAVLDRFLADHPDVDGGRVGIYGGSYGGFMTEYLVGETDRFAAAVSMYGIASLSGYWGAGAWGWTYGDMAVGGETPWSDPDLFWRRSPLYRADRIETPLLLMHGTADVNVPPGESEQLFTALRIQDRPVELVLFPGEGHGLSGNRRDRAAHRTMLLEWFDRWLRGQPEAWEHRWEGDDR